MFTVPEGESTKEAFMTYADLGKSVPLTEKIVAKYLGDLSTPMAKRMVDGVRNDSTVLVEISPSTSQPGTIPRRSTRPCF